jgi:hypothetical protein
VLALLAPARLQAQDGPVRQALLVADSIGQLALALRAYAQLGQQVEPAQAAERLVQGRTEFDASLALLLRRIGRQLPAADTQRLQQRWRSVRDATYTRPSPEIGALMVDIGEDIAGQLRALVQPPPQAHPLFERTWQRKNLQQLAKEGLFGCWRADLASWTQMDTLRAEFGRWLAGQESRLAPVAWVQYNAQWNLLTTSLPREGVGCTRQAMQSLVGTTERLIQMIATLQ